MCNGGHPVKKGNLFWDMIDEAKSWCWFESHRVTHSRVYPPTFITRHLRLCGRCKQYRPVAPGCKIPGGLKAGRVNRFICAECAKKSAERY